MADCIENGCLEENCVEGGDSAPTATCDLTELTTLINAQNTVIASLMTKVDTLQTTIDNLDVGGGGTDYAPRFDELELKLDDNKSKILSNITVATAINTKVVDIRDNMVTMTDYTATALIANDLTSLVPSIDDMAIRVLPIGTRVQISDIDSVCVIRSSRYLPDGEFHYMVVYDLEIEDSSPSRVSSYPASMVVEYEEEVT